MEYASVHLQKFEYIPSSPTVGETVYLTVTVMNSGTGGGNGFVEILDPSDSLLASHSIRVSAHGTEAWTATFVPTTAGQTFIRARMAGETMTVYINVGGPVLRINHWKNYDPYCADYEDLTVYVDNTGSAPAAGVVMHVVVSDSGGNQVSVKDVSGDDIPPGGQTAIRARLFVRDSCGFSDAYYADYTVSATGAQAVEGSASFDV